MKISLVYPPIWDCDSPYPSLALLSAFLKKNSYDVCVRDLNIELQSRMLSDDYIHSVIMKLEKIINESAGENDKKQSAIRAIAFYKSVGKGSFDKALSVLRNSTSDIKQIVWAKSLIEGGRYIISAPYAPSRIKVDTYVSTQTVDNIRVLLEEAADRKNNVFYEILREEVISDFNSFDVLGLSITGVGQLVPAFTVVQLLKEMFPQIKIVIGGALMPFMKDAILNSPQIFSLVDAVIVGEGETALTEWIQYLEGEHGVEDVSNLIYLDADNRVRETGKYHAENMNELPTPDYSMFPWEQYFLSNRILTYISSRGCPWNKCSFCSLTTNYGRQYRERDIVRIVEDIKKMKSEYNTNYIMFDDESLSTKRIKEFSEAFIENGLDIRWICLSRFDKTHNLSIFQKAYQSGLRMVTYGLESGSQGILNSMNKGTIVENIPKVLQQSKNAGIWNNTFIIFGFPGEKEEDRQKTYRFIAENSNLIDSLTYGEFRVEGGSEIYRMPEKYGIELEKVESDFFGPIYPFKYKDGSTVNDVFGDMLKFQGITKDEPFNQFNFYGYDPRRMFISLDVGGKYNLRKEIMATILRKRQINNILKWGVIPDIILQVNKSTVIRTVSDNFPSPRYLIYNCENGNNFEINNSALEILNILQNGVKYAEMIEMYAEKYSLPFENAQKDILNTLIKFINDEYVQYYF